MDIKIKILKILPIWLIILALICALQSAVFLFIEPPSSSKQSQVQINAEPLVLGEATSIRGEPTGQDQARPIEKIKEPDLSLVKAKSYLVFDLETGQNLIEKNSQAKLSIASLTKLLTAFVAYQNADLNQNVIISSKGTTNIKPNLGLNVGDEIKALDLFNSMLIGSCNDAALSLANYVQNISGQDFIGLMNSGSRALGMSGSNFSNPMGFDSKFNYSTAKDIQKLIMATEQLFVFKSLGRRTFYEFTSFLGHSYSTLASNKLIKTHSDIEAIKTGYTQDAGGAMATKITVNGHQIVILVLGSQDREEDSLKLKDLVLDSFDFK